MGKRRTTSRAVADLAPNGQSAVPACAARGDGRNDDSVLLSRHRRLLSEPLMWATASTNAASRRQLSLSNWKSTAADHCLLLSIEALSLAMAIRQDRTMTNVRLWSVLWQEQIIDKHQRAGAAA
jgi:hypothetical protein